jgi:molecular chaperone DnaJ
LWSVTKRTHYSVLGVSAGASPESIREAYRRLAREYHPDRTSGSAVGGGEMPAINEAYRVLSDPARRAVYDASLRGGSGSASSDPTAAPSGDEEPGDEAMQEWRFQHPEGPARIPWRSLMVFSLIAILGILILAQFTDPAEPSAPDGILRNGDCVEVLDNNMVGEIACEGEGDLVVRQFIAFDRRCSNGWIGYQDRQGMGIACVETRPTPSS